MKRTRVRRRTAHKLASVWPTTATAVVVLQRRVAGRFGALRIVMCDGVGAHVVRKCGGCSFDEGMSMICLMPIGGAQMARLLCKRRFEGWAGRVAYFRRVGVGKHVCQQVAGII